MTQTRASKKARRPVRTAKIDPLANSKRFLESVLSTLDGDKAEDVVTIALSGKSTIADYMVVATGRSSRHVTAMAAHLRERLKADGSPGIALEGAARGDWVLIDGGDVIVHLFRPEVREFYGLEKMWGVDMTDGLDPAPEPKAKT